ncbi:SUMO-interacting motif-containing protein 1 [Mantella aurantiaca]
MEDTIIISDEEDEPLGAQSRDSDIIDLTSNHCVLENLPEMDSNVIDLTANEDGLGLSSVSSSEDELSETESSEDLYLPSTGSSAASSEDEEGTSEFSWGTDSTTNSIENSVLQTDISSTRKEKCLTDEPGLSTPTKDQSLTDEPTRNKKCLAYKANHKEPSCTALTLLQGWSPIPTSVGGEGSSDYATRFPNVNCQPQSDTDSICSVPTAGKCDTPSSPIQRALLYKLRRFKKAPVSHYFHRPKKTEKSERLKPVPQTRMSIVNNTMEESIHQGTLHCLSEFVTAKHYPPKDIVMHVIQSMLLGAEEEAIKHEAYMILMKVQMFHPAGLNTVAWNWSQLSEVMERKENHTCHLFLQYVVQTLDDDFDIHLKHRKFQKSLSKTVLSCDKANIKNVIAWLMHAVENACDIAVNGELDARTECQERVVCLLQRMLSIAVEVDNLPVTNSNRIADLLFPYVIVLKTRQQRELFFSSTENHLLRAKILELIFLNSCESVPPANLPLSLCKILHFISNSTLLLENQGPEWQRWDEILHHICLLFLSLQSIITGHLRIPITDRADEMSQRPQRHLPFHDDNDVTKTDVEQCLMHFWSRAGFGSDVPDDLQNQFYMLKSLLLTAV